jgi:hypothetical protein
MTFAKSGTKPALKSPGWLLVLLSRPVKNAFRSWEERMHHSTVLSSKENADRRVHRE